MIDADRAPAGDVEVGCAEDYRQVFGLKTQRGDDHVGIQRKVARRVILGRAASARIGRAEPHFGDMHSFDGVAAVKGFRAGQPDEFDAFFLCIGYFTLRPRHVFPVAAVEAFDRFCTLADGCPDAIHCGVATTYNDHVFALCIERTVIKGFDRIPETLAIGRGKEFKRSNNSV